MTISSSGNGSVLAPKAAHKPPASGIIDEEQLERAFNDIVKCLSSDEDYGPSKDGSRRDHASTPNSGSNACAAIQWTDASSSTNSNHLSNNSNYPLSTPTSWGKRFDKAVGGMTRVNSYVPSMTVSPVRPFYGSDATWKPLASWHPHAAVPSAPASPTGYFSKTPFFEPPPQTKMPYRSVPPGDYVCRLCLVPGHWLKDCHMYRPYAPKSSGGKPPGNYVCRLCDIPGHWIEDCELFEARPKGESSRPPASYICKLCQEPGHWIQHCAHFVPIHRRLSSS